MAQPTEKKFLNMKKIPIEEGLLHIPDSPKVLNKLNKKLGTNRKDTIIEMATLLFFKNGYDNTSIKELANASEISVAGIYYFFKDKEEILFNIIDESIVSLQQALKTAIVENDEPQKNLLRIIKNLIKNINEKKMEISIRHKESQRLNQDQSNIINNKIDEAIGLINCELENLNMQGKLKSINLTVVTFSIFAMVNWTVRYNNIRVTLTIDELTAELSKLLFTGILKDE